MGKNFKSELVGVFGHPVAENPTIIMLETAFKEKKLDWRYLTIEVLPQNLKEAVAGMRAMNMKGINLTIPHKIEVMKYLDIISPDAQLIGAVNTVRREDNILIGENTDGKGFLRSLSEDAGTTGDGKNIFILGAGGAARAISVELALAGAARITIVNRNKSRGNELVHLLNSKTNSKALFIPWDKTIFVPADTDILINATSIGLYPEISDKPDIIYSSIGKEMIVCDVIPNPPQTEFLKEAEKQGAKTIDGLGMLVYQGAIGFRMWTGLEAPAEVMYEALKNTFQGE